MADNQGLRESLVKAAAKLLWHEAFTEDERTLVRFGLFPRQKMEATERQLREHGVEHDTTRLLAVALMSCAEADGGMIA